MIYLGVDADLFFRRSERIARHIKNKLGVKANKYLLLCLAKIRKRKGLLFLIQACVRLTKSTPIRLVITGAGEPKQDEYVLKKLLKKKV